MIHWFIDTLITRFIDRSWGLKMPNLLSNAHSILQNYCFYCYSWHTRMSPVSGSKFLNLYNFNNFLQIIWQLNGPAEHPFLYINKLFSGDPFSGFGSIKNISGENWSIFLTTTIVRIFKWWASPLAKHEEYRSIEKVVSQYYNGNFSSG